MTHTAMFFALALNGGLALAQNVTHDDDDCSIEYPHCLELDDTDIASMESVVGRIVAMSEVLLCSSQSAFLTLSLQSNDRRAGSTLREVYLAPKAFLQRNGLKLEVGDEVTVFGVSSWNTVAGELTVIQVEKDGKSFFLRDASGRALWLPGRPSS